MTTSREWLLGALVLVSVAGLNQVALAARSYWYLKRKSRRDHNRSKPYLPSTVLICPCCGLDPGFEANIAAMLDLDYRDYHVVFAVESEADPAHPVLSRLLARSQRGTLITAGAPTARGAKVHNLLAAANTSVAKHCEVLAFIDSDVSPPRSWLLDLLQPLSDPAVGLATGYRWYQPLTWRLGSWMRAVGNNIGMAPYMLSDHALTAWGGAMAVRRMDFERSDVRDVWARAIDDDITLSDRIRKLELRIEFVPACLTHSTEDCTLAQYFHWLRRQTFMVKVYNPALWRLSFVSFLPMALMLFGLSSLAASAVFPSLQLYGWILLSVVPLQMLGGLLTAAAFADARIALWVMPAVLISGAMSVVAILATAFSNRIVWRGTAYEVVAPMEVRILGTMKGHGGTEMAGFSDGNEALTVLTRTFERLVPEDARSLDMVYAYRFTDIDWACTLALRPNDFRFVAGSSAEAETTIETTSDVFDKVMRGEMNVVFAHLSGKARILGSLGDVLKLRSVAVQVSRAYRTAIAELAADKRPTE